MKCTVTCEWQECSLSWLYLRIRYCRHLKMIALKRKGRSQNICGYVGCVGVCEGGVGWGGGVWECVWVCVCGVWGWVCVCVCVVCGLVCGVWGWGWVAVCGCVGVWGCGCGVCVCVSFWMPSDRIYCRVIRNRNKICEQYIAQFRYRCIWSSIFLFHFTLFYFILLYFILSYFISYLYCSDLTNK